MNESETIDEKFHARLEALVREAHADGVGVEGGWPLLDPEGTEGAKWDVEIVGVETPE